MPASTAKYTIPSKLTVMGKPIIAEFEALVQQTEGFAQRVGDSMRANPREASGFIRQCVEVTPLLFQKWNLEILYLLALSQTLRFSQLKEVLAGISSRTLSLKLTELEKNGLLNRRVHEGRPLRVDYSLTTDGRTLSRLTVPMVIFLNLRMGLRQQLEEKVRPAT